MLELNRITNAAAVPEALLVLYEESFPDAERRSREQLYYLIGQHDDFYFNEIRYAGEPAGLFVYWDLDDFYFMEHLAVYPAMRNHKIGTKLLEYAAACLPKPRILEVEPDTEEMAARRIRYYERNGYAVVDRHYVQPPFDETKKPVALWIMSSHSLTDECRERFVGTVLAKVYEANRRWRG